MTRCICCLVLAALVPGSGWAQKRAPFPLRPLRALEDALVFHPSTDKQSWFEAPPGVEVHDVWLQSKDGQRIHGWWLPYPNSDGAVLYCHGNAGNVTHWAARAYGLRTALGRGVLVIDYPGYGKSSGVPGEAGCCAAAEAGHAWLCTKVSPQRIVLLGESLGGGVATELATRLPHEALVLMRTFTSIPDIARQRIVTYSSAPLVRNTFDNLGRIRHCPKPIFIAHGDRDRVIPLSQARQLYEAAQGRKQFFLMHGLGHGEPWPDDCLTALRDFLRQ
jgi:fermentation-respiration switch protein FrsA (DUF1100 family)